MKASEFVEALEERALFYKERENNEFLSKCGEDELYEIKYELLNLKYEEETAKSWLNAFIDMLDRKDAVAFDLLERYQIKRSNLKELYKNSEIMDAIIECVQMHFFDF